MAFEATWRRGVRPGADACLLGRYGLSISRRARSGVQDHGMDCLACLPPEEPGEERPRGKHQHDAQDQPSDTYDNRCFDPDERLRVVVAGLAVVAERLYRN